MVTVLEQLVEGMRGPCVLLHNKKTELIRLLEVRIMYTYNIMTPSYVEMERYNNIVYVCIPWLCSCIDMQLIARTRVLGMSKQILVNFHHGNAGELQNGSDLGFSGNILGFSRA